MLKETRRAKTVGTKSGHKPSGLILLFVGAALVLIGAVLYVTTGPGNTTISEGISPSECPTFEYRIDKEINYKFLRKLEIANDAAARTKGLSGRSCIPNDTGLLFVFDTPGIYPFWMKDMKFAIDIVWLDIDKKVVHIEKNVEPSTYPRTFSSTEPAVYVLEVKAGEPMRTGMMIGDVLNW